MSLYEALDRFVGTGVLACAGLVGNEMPGTVRLDGAAFSRFLRDVGHAEDYGAVLDAMARDIWLAQQQRGFPQTVCEAHAIMLAAMLDEVRPGMNELGPALESARRALSAAPSASPEMTVAMRQQIAAAWLAVAQASGHVQRAGLIDDVARYLLEQLFMYIIEQPRFLVSLSPPLAAFRAKIALPSQPQPAPVADPLAAAPQPQPEPQPAAPQAATTQLVPNVAAKPDSRAAVALPLSVAVADIKARHNVSEGALRRFQSILALQSLSAEQRVVRLDELAQWLAATVAQLTRPGNDQPDLRRTKLEAAAALDAGDLERAMDLLKEVRQYLRSNRRRTEARIAEEMETLKQQMIEEATAAGRLGELALARLDFEAAADLFAEAAGNVPATETALELDFKQRQAEALAAKAEATGEARELQLAATAYRGCLSMMSRDRDPVGWVRVNVGLGDMLMALGIRNTQSALELEQAAAAYEAAVTSIDKALHPMRWALVQLSHAAALIEVGTRVERDRNWKAASVALMPALEVFEMRGASDLAQAARARLRIVAAGLQPPVPALDKPALAG